MVGEVKSSDCAEVEAETWRHWRFKLKGDSRDTLTKLLRREGVRSVPSGSFSSRVDFYDFFPNVTERDLDRATWGWEIKIEVRRDICDEFEALAVASGCRLR